ncbi:hypothetical protein ARMGADRAFT_1014595 [Armillaria gallica]|uniref:Uncharacterized protein n=1 Tax=Armillaria gallica TaxID=47427 RepID=A0A2H3DQE3_ARMGA|nr:hypothetical protein ARMGADRAFT_1014595 [Armillaria gallica]
MGTFVTRENLTLSNFPVPCYRFFGYMFGLLRSNAYALYWIWYTGAYSAAVMAM